MKRLRALLGHNWHYPVLAAPALFALGILFWGGFNWSLDLANSERFCISCHEMRSTVYQEYRGTIHDTNRTGVRATCPDCHVPRQWWPKVVRKVSATRELYLWAIGSVSTPEKFYQRREALAQQVWRTMKASGSRECRNCHNVRAMDATRQKPAVAKLHHLAAGWKIGCIECHQGIAHQLPEGFDREAALDDVHDRIKKEKIDCHSCHESIRRARSDDEW